MFPPQICPVLFLKASRPGAISTTFVKEFHWLIMPQVKKNTCQTLIQFLYMSPGSGVMEEKRTLSTLSTPCIILYISNTSSFRHLLFGQNSPKLCTAFLVREVLQPNNHFGDSSIPFPVSLYPDVALLSICTMRNQILEKSEYEVRPRELRYL